MLKFIFGLLSILGGLSVYSLLVWLLVKYGWDDAHWSGFLAFIGATSITVYPLITRFWTQTDPNALAIKKENKVLELRIEQKKLKEELGNE